MPEKNERVHRYHAEASALKGHLKLPIAQEIEPQVHTKLPETGGYLTQRTEIYRIESIISFRSAFTHVGGNRSDKPGGGFTTLTTTVVEGLNVMEVVTADRVVGQMITEHPLDGYIPSISFLGTRFDNLRIAGHPVHVEFDQGIFGPEPVNDVPYTREPGFVSRVGRQYDRIRQNKNLPEALQERYNRLSSTLGASEEAECSLINQVGGLFPGTIAGNVIRVPGFGTVTLAKLVVKHEDPHAETKVPTKTTFHLTMIDLELGCAASGNVPIGNGTSNGGGVG
ncbi:MAG: hypothetical protein ABSB60_02565 [Terracidiphilus sp.]|jgi:hypothetical protein